MAALLFFYPPPTANIVWQVLVQTPPLRKCSATFKVTLCDWQTAATANRPSVPAGLIKPEIPSPIDTQRPQQHGGKIGMKVLPDLVGRMRITGGANIYLYMRKQCDARGLTSVNHVEWVWVKGSMCDIWKNLLTWNGIENMFRLWV